MFQRFTEKARRAIFFARYEASQYGSPYIETEHLLLGLFREHQALTDRLLQEDRSIEAIRKEIESQIKINKRISTSVEMPLTSECRRILNFAVQEADLLTHTHVGTEHLLLGILREDKCRAAKILHAFGLELAALRLELRRGAAIEAKSLHRPAPEVGKIGEVLEQLLNAWTARDARKFSSLFEERGQLWDVRGEKWTGPASIEKALVTFFSRESKPRKGNVRDIKYVRRDVSVVAIVWELEGVRREHLHSNLVMSLVVTQTGPGWLVSSAFLSHSLPT
jgi:uncharacterized protein (TIGR02246 family)